MTERTMFSHNDYEVAWICALPLEMTAAKTMLDTLHDRLSQPTSDHNTYTLGSVGGHNIVVACLPSGVYGTTSAAIVLAQMLQTFPSLRFGLMVGIGGGVPSKDADIRLGDVVISMPTATFGAVVQYDYGKTLRNGRFERTGSLNKPPQYLLTAISQMRSDHTDGTTSIGEITSEVLEKHQKLQEQFSRPEQDWLFEASYDHEGNNADCMKCEASHLVTRNIREAEDPVIHYGLIASGNQVMKNATARDAIAQEMNILCFEMEAAGLMDQLPCLVVRGICDYCDSHKHKQWQGYSALTAAAYTKALLGRVPSHAQSQIKNTSKTSHWIVPFARNSRFVGRQQEIDYIEKLIVSAASPTKVSVYGLGGIGKTQIALEIAYLVREKVPECSIFWIPCVSYESVEQAYMKIASAMGISGTEPARMKEQVKSRLSQENAGKWLLVFDNADDMDMWTKGGATAPPLQEILPSSETGHILFTSRNRKLAVRVASPNVLLVPDIDDVTATKILERSLIKKGLLCDNNATTALLEQLGYLPLAINQAAAYINENGITLSDYLSLMKDRETDAAELLSEEFHDDGRYAETQNPVLTTWMISFRQIQDSNTLASEYLSFIACISPRDIPQSILPPPASAKRKTDALGLLGAYSFIGEHSGGSSFSLHRLVHLAMRNWMRRNEVFEYWLRKTSQRLDEIYPGDEYTNQALWRIYLPHALYLIESEDFHGIHSEYLGLSSRVGRSLESDGRYNEAQMLFIGCLEASDRDLGPDHPETITSVGDLASVLLRQGKFKEAEAMQRRDLLGNEKAWGLEHPKTLTSLSILALTIQQQGKYTKAETIHRQALESKERFLGPEHPNTIESVYNLGTVLGEQGQYEEAENMLRRALQSNENGLGAEHPSTLRCVNHLGLVLEEQVKYEEAEAMYRRALEGRERLLGLGHPETLNSVSLLGSVLQHQCMYQEAEAMYRRALEGREQALGLEHPETLTGILNLGSVLEEQGNHREAETLSRQALEGLEKALGPEHPAVVNCIASLGSVLQKQGKYEEAEKMHRQALECKGKNRGPEHPETLDSVMYVGSVLEDLGKHKEAEAMHRRALEGYQKTLGPEHPSTLASLAYLGSVLKHRGKYEEAETMLGGALEGYEKALGAEHPYTLSTASHLGLVLEQQARYKEAEALQRRALEGREKFFGPEHPDTLLVKERLAAILEKESRSPAQMFPGNHPLFRSLIGTSCPLALRCDLDEVD